MAIAELFQKKSTVFSFEVFPPKRTSSIDTIYSTLDQLKNLRPDFISVTYGAGGNVADQSTCEIASIIQNTYHIEPLAHLTCVSSTKEEILQNLARLKERNIRSILALRGDFSPDHPPKTDFRHASDLIAFIREQDPEFHLSAACYPEGHIECDSLVEDVLNLKRKADAGAEHLVSQLFFDNAAFYAFLERARIAGITQPIEAGIMPVVNKKQIERMVSMCGASLPAKFSRIMSRYENKPEALRDAGIAYAIDQIVDLVSNGVQGIHLYTMNNPMVARRITESVASLFD